MNPVVFFWRSSCGCVGDGAEFSSLPFCKGNHDVVELRTEPRFQGERLWHQLDPIFFPTEKNQGGNFIWPWKDMGHNILFFLHRQAWDWNFLRCLQVGASTTTWPKKNPKKTLLGAKQLIKRRKRRNSSSLSLSHRLSSKKAWKKPPTKTTFFGNARDSLGSNLCPYLPNGCVITYLSHQGVTCTPNWSKAGRNSHVCSEI